MAEGLDYDYLPQNNSSWEFLDEGSIKKELDALISRLGETAVYLDKFAHTNEYEKMSQLFKDCWVKELGPEGWIGSYLLINADSFDKPASGGSKPDSYNGLSLEDKKAFDMCLNYYREFKSLQGTFEKIRKIMMVFPLSRGFKLIRFTLNFMDAGYDESVYKEADDNLNRVCEILNKSWDYWERCAIRANDFYKANSGKLGKSDLNRGYREARIRDFQQEVEILMKEKTFVPYTNGTFSVELNHLMEYMIIDEYTIKIASLPNVSDDMDNASQGCKEVLNELNKIYEGIKTDHGLKLVDALRKLVHAIDEFAVLSSTVFKRFKDRDDEAPFCFVKKPSSFSKMNGKYGFVAPGGDPWHDGTQFRTVFERAAKALSDLCQDFVYNHGHTELK